MKNFMKIWKDNKNQKSKQNEKKNILIRILNKTQIEPKILHDSVRRNVNLYSEVDQTISMLR